MSITFTPEKGTWKAAHYFVYEDEDPNYMDISNVSNGIIRFEDYEPSVQCHNSGGGWLIATFQLTDMDEDYYCGSFEAAQVAELLTRVEQWQDALTDEPSYCTRKVADFEQMLRHCRYHECGFHWG